MTDAEIKAQMDLWVANGTLPNDIMGVDFNKRFTSVGKNLFDETKLEQGTIVPSTGIIDTSLTRVRTDYIKLKNAVNYNVSIVNSNYNLVNIHYYDANQIWITSQFALTKDTDGAITYSFQMPQNITCVRFVFRNTVTSSNITPQELYNNIQLNKAQQQPPINLTYQPSSMFLQLTKRK